MVCTVIARQPGGVQRHARLAAEVGATWDDIAGSVLLTRTRLRHGARHSSFARGAAGLQAGIDRLAEALSTVT